jgi:DNA-binding transcriptional ArsR family regulator
MDEIHARTMAAFLTALCDPTRLRLISLMADGPVSVGFLAESTGESQPKVSRHLACLRNSDLVSTNRDGKHIYYQLRWPQHSDQRRVIAGILGNGASQITSEVPQIGHTYDEPHISPELGEVIEIHLL